MSASISDVAFFPASGHGYLLVLTSADNDDIITINLSTGKVDKMKGEEDVSPEGRFSCLTRGLTGYFGMEEVGFARKVWYEGSCFARKVAQPTLSEAFTL